MLLLLGGQREKEKERGGWGIDLRDFFGPGCGGWQMTDEKFSKKIYYILFFVEILE